MLTDNQIQWAKYKDRANERRRAAYFIKNQEAILARIRRKEESVQAECLRREVAAIQRAQPPVSRKDRKTAQKRLVRELKKGLCLDCGGVFHTDAMEFDHARGEKVFDIGKSKGRSLKQLKEELAKCDLVCANCHRVRTARRREGLPATLPPPEYEI
jgi:5-methylcytosine-specific restriction endonuclease McrA